MENITLPSELSSFVSSENKDFTVKAGHDDLPLIFVFILLGTIWTAFTSISMLSFLVPIFQGKEVHFETNGVPTVASAENLGPIVMPVIIIGIFVLVGIGMLYWGLSSLFKREYFVGTPNRLVHFKNGNIKSINWEQFSGDIEVSGNTKKGDISLQMKIDRMDDPESIPDEIYILGIQNVFEIEQICRKRIKKNDPIPTTTKYNIS